MKNTLKLKIACVLIWASVLGVCTLGSLQIKSDKKITEVMPVSQIAENNNFINVINGNNNIFIMANFVQPFSEKDFMIIQWAQKITAVRAIEYNDENFTFKDGLSLAEKIANAADETGLDYSQGLIICHIESDFNKNAYNSRGKAYGLCQITQPCLDEYNWNNGTKYTLDQVMDPDLNLKIGFWYYHRLLTHYKKYPEYGIHGLKDAYIAYNLGVTTFKNVGKNGRMSLRNGIYPCSIYGAKKGSKYKPSSRYDKIAS